MATVTDSGTPNNHIFDFTIPRGATGATGPKGATGATGPTGPTGTCRCCVSLRSILSAKGQYSDNEEYVRLNGSSVYPPDSADFTVNQDGISFNTAGFYIIQFTADYAVTSGTATIAAELNGKSVSSVPVTLARTVGNASGLCAVNAGAGDVFRLKLNGFSKLVSADFNILVACWLKNSDK